MRGQQQQSNPYISVTICSLLEIPQLLALCPVWCRPLHSYIQRTPTLLMWDSIRTQLTPNQPPSVLFSEEIIDYLFNSPDICFSPDLPEDLTEDVVTYFIEVEMCTFSCSGDLKVDQPTHI